MKKYFPMVFLVLWLTAALASAAITNSHRSELAISIQPDGVYDDPDLFTEGDTVAQKIILNLYEASESQPMRLTKQLDLPIDYGQTPVAALTFPLPPDKDFVCITAANQFSLKSKAVITRQGNSLTADFTGANQLIQGDLNQDGIIDESDLSLVNALYGSTKKRDLAKADINQDGIISTGDFTFVQINFGREDQRCD